MRNLFSLHYNNRVVTTYSYGYAVNLFNSLQLRDLTATVYICDVHCTARGLVYHVVMVKVAQTAKFGVKIFQIMYGY